MKHEAPPGIGCDDWLGDNMIRAKQVTAKELDETLVALQTDGAKIWQVHPCPTNFKGTGEDIGKGQSTWGATVEMNFMVTYLATPPKAEVS